MPESFTQFDFSNDYFAIYGNGCLTAGSESLRAWLNEHDPDWEDGCI